MTSSGVPPHIDECQSGRRFSDLWQTCELPRGHDGDHGCTYKGEEWVSWPNSAKTRTNYD